MNKWRLPTVKELITLVDYSYICPATNSDMIRASVYWTSTEAVSGKIAFTVDFTYGTVNYHNKNDFKFVIAVRKTDEGKLEWCEDITAVSMTWKEAIAWCDKTNEVKNGFTRS